MLSSTALFGCIALRVSGMRTWEDQTGEHFIFFISFPLNLLTNLSTFFTISTLSSSECRWICPHLDIKGQRLGMDSGRCDCRTKICALDVWLRIQPCVAISELSTCTDTCTNSDQATIIRISAFKIVIHTNLSVLNLSHNIKCS